jgi:protein required for attachment to host cells
VPIRTEHWIATIDEGGGRLLCCRRTAGGRWNVVEKSTISNEHSAQHDHHRPAMLGRAPGGRPQLAAHARETEEDRRRFANQAAVWLMDAASDFDLEKVDIFAPGRMLHDLRDEWTPARRDTMIDHEGELTNIPVAELAKHPAILLVLSLSPAGRHGL